MPRHRSRSGKLLLDAGRYEEAKMRADAVLEADSKNIDAQLLAASTLAEMKALGGDRSDAESAFRKAVRMAGRSASAHVAFARFLLTANRPGEAGDELKQALAAAPDDELANRAMAAFCQAQGRFADAEPYLTGRGRLSSETAFDAGLRRLPGRGASLRGSAASAVSRAVRRRAGAGCAAAYGGARIRHRVARQGSRTCSNAP